MRKFKLFITTIIAFLFCLSFTSAQEIGRITNVDILADGTVNFDAVEGATEYWVGINGNKNTFGDDFNVMDRLETHCQNEELMGMCNENYTGTYAFEMEARDGDALLAVYYAKMTYDGHSFLLTDQENDPCLVIYHTDGGSFVDWEIVTYGERAHRPNNPEKEGKTFGGWYADQGLNNAFDFNTDITTRVTRVFAKWNDPVEIEEIEITGVVKPRVGVTPSTNNIQITTEGVGIRQAAWVEDKDGWDIDHPATSFVQGKKYMLIIILDVENGYVLSESLDEDHMTINIPYLKAEFVKDGPDFRIYYEAAAALTKPTTPTLRNPYNRFVDYNSGVFNYELGLNFNNYVIDPNAPEPQYKVDGYELYEVDGDEYTLAGVYKMGTPATVNIEIGESKTLVSRVFINVDAENRLFSDYSNVLTLNHTKPTTPELRNPYNRFVDYNSGVFTYELGLNFNNYIVDPHAEDAVYTIDGYELYEVDGEEYTSLGTFEIGSPAIVNVALGTTKTLVSRVYTLNTSSQTVYSEFSNVLTIDHSKITTPVLKNPYNTYVDRVDDTFTYEIGLDFANYLVDPHAEDFVYFADGYELYEVNGEELTLVGTYEMGSPATINIDLGTAKTYVARVYALNTSSEMVFSDYSNELLLDQANLPLDKPIAKTHNANNNTLLIDWEEVTYAHIYSVWRSTDKKTWTKIHTTEELSYTDTGLTYGKTYYYRVKALNDKYSKYSDIITGVTKPNKMTIRVTGAGTNNVKLAWDKINVTGYTIYSSTDNKTWSKVKEVTPATTLELNIKSLKTNKVYFFRARAYKTVSGSNVYGAYSDVVKTRTAPETPTLALKVINYETIRLVIGESKGATSYRIYRSTDNKTWERIDIIDQAGKYYDRSHELGTTYYYKVRACNVYDNCSAYAAGSLKQTVATPSLTLTSTKAKSVTVTVGSVENASGYRVYRATSKNGTYTMIADIKDPEKLTFNNSTKRGYTYYYKVRAYSYYDGSKLYSAFSGIKSVKSK